MSRHRKVEIQKGNIIANPPNRQQSTYSDRERQAVEEAHMRRKCQTLDLHTPKTGR